MDCLLTFEHMISYAEETYGSNSFNVLQGRLSNFATSPFPLPNSTDEVIQLRRIDSLKICSTYLVNCNGFLGSIPGFTYETDM